MVKTKEELKLFKQLKALAEYCNGQKNCKKCIFAYKDRCMVDVLNEADINKKIKSYTVQP